jgi:hypothetical protein
MVGKSFHQPGTELETSPSGKKPKSLLFHTRTERPKCPLASTRITALR